MSGAPGVRELAEDGARARAVVEQRAVEIEDDHRRGLRAVAGRIERAAVHDALEERVLPSGL